MVQVYYVPAEDTDFCSILMHQHKATPLLHVHMKLARSFASSGISKRALLAATAVLLLISGIGVGIFSSMRQHTSHTIAVIPRTCGTWLWEAEHTGATRAAASYGQNIYWNAPMREDDVQGQIDILAQAVSRHMAGIILSPVEELPLRTPVRNALSHGLPVVVVDTDLGLPVSKQLSYVLNDEHLGGQLAARRVGMLLGGHGSVAVLGISHLLTTSSERARSFETTLSSEFPRIHVIARSQARDTVSEEQQNAEKLLTANHDLGAIIALSEFSTRGAYYALTEFERTHQTHLIGFDQNLLAPIRTRDIDSVVIQNTDRMGREAVRIVAEHASTTQYGKRMIIAPMLVTPQNIDSPEVLATLDLGWYQ